MANNPLGARAQFEDLVTLNYTDIVFDEWNLLGNFVFANPIRIIILQNYTDVAVSFSFAPELDFVLGSLDPRIKPQLVLPAGGQIVLDVSGNRTNPSEAFFFPVGTQAYVTPEAAPTSGNIYMSRIYGV